jgi:hypothetical protein
LLDIEQCEDPTDTDTHYCHSLSGSFFFNHCAPPPPPPPPPSLQCGRTFSAVLRLLAELGGNPWAITPRPWGRGGGEGGASRWRGRGQDRYRDRGWGRERERQRNRAKERGKDRGCRQAVF